MQVHHCIPTGLMCQFTSITVSVLSGAALLQKAVESSVLVFLFLKKTLLCFSFQEGFQGRIVDTLFEIECVPAHSSPR